MTDNPFDDLLNKENPFSDILEEMFGKGKHPIRDEDPKGRVLLSTFRTEIRRGDKSYLEKTVIEYKEEVFERRDNVSLLESYARASLFVDNVPLGYEALKKINSPNERQIQSLGLIAYDMDNFGESIRHFKSIENKLSSPAKISYSLAVVNAGIKNLPVHQKILNPILEKSDLANSILGVLSIESQDTKRAEGYFSNAVKLNPKSERTRFDLMRVKVLNGKQNEVFSGMNDFYIQTNSSLSAEEITKELEAE